MSNRRFVVFDADHSLSSVGGPRDLEEIFGVPPVRIDFGIDQVEAYLLGREGKNPALISRETEPEEHPIFGSLPGQGAWTISEVGQKYDIDGFIIDTYSELAEQTKDRLIEEHKKEEMSQYLWTLFNDKVRRFNQLLSKLEVPIIVTSHIRRDSDEKGRPMDAPGLPGSQNRQNTPRYFDAVLYTRIEQDKNGDVRYYWQSRGDNRRIFAKNRKDILPTYLDQNLGEVLSAYEEEGIQPSVLILGDAGQGKTVSLSTINGIPESHPTQTPVPA